MKPFCALADAADELRPPGESDPRRLFKGGFREFGDLVHLLGENSNGGQIAVEIDFDDDDTRVDGRSPLFHAKLAPEIGERHDFPANVDQAVRERIGRRHLRYGRQIQDLADACRFEREQLAIEVQGQNLESAALHGRS